MPYDPTTNFRDSNGVDLGDKLITKDYLLTVYGEILNSIGNSGLTVTPALWIWGWNDSARLGINDGVNRSTPVTTFAGGINWESVACGRDHTLAIKTDGTLWSWGRNNNVQLGINNTTNKSTPVTTSSGGTDWKEIGATKYSSYAIKTNGTLWTWGLNDRGQLGINATTNRTTPVTTFAGGTNWKTLFKGCALQAVAAIKTDGTLWTWGLNENGELGINDTNGLLGASALNKSTPVTTFAGGTNWKSVSCGHYNTYAIKTDGTLWSWGDNDVGQLGINEALVDKITPVTTFLGGNDWKQISAGDSFAAAIDSVDYI